MLSNRRRRSSTESGTSAVSTYGDVNEVPNGTSPVVSANCPVVPPRETNLSPLETSRLLCLPGYQKIQIVKRKDEVLGLKLRSHLGKFEVSFVSIGSPAHSAGVQVGERLLYVNRGMVVAENVKHLMRCCKSETTVELIFTASSSHAFMRANRRSSDLTPSSSSLSLMPNGTLSRSQSESLSGVHPLPQFPPPSPLVAAATQSGPREVDLKEMAKTVEGSWFIRRPTLHEEETE